MVRVEGLAVDGHFTEPRLLSLGTAMVTQCRSREFARKPPRTMRRRGYGTLNPAGTLAGEEMQQPTPKGRPREGAQWATLGNNTRFAVALTSAAPRGVFIGKGGGSRTCIPGFGDRRSAIELHQFILSRLC